MNDDLWAGFLLGCAIGFDMDSFEVEALLKKVGLSQENSITACQYAVKEHVGDERWWMGVKAIREVAEGE